jgi:hypothetical protein
MVCFLLADVDSKDGIRGSISPIRGSGIKAVFPVPARIVGIVDPEARGEVTINGPESKAVLNPSRGFTFGVFFERESLARDEKRAVEDRLNCAVLMRLCSTPSARDV